MFKFSKARMIKRLTEAGKADMIDDDVKAIMDNLDGQEANRQCWSNTVYGEPVCWVIGKDGTGYYVHEDDCLWGL